MNKRTRFCVDCGNWRGSKGTTKYCPTCIADGKHLHTKKFEDAKTDWLRRKILIGESGQCCWSCKNSEWQSNPIPLELDHIDGNHENNSRENLRILCPNCHALTPTYKAKNKGNGRPNRRIE